MISGSPALCWAGPRPAAPPTPSLESAASGLYTQKAHLIQPQVGVQLMLEME